MNGQHEVQEKQSDREHDCRNYGSDKKPFNRRLCHRKKAKSVEYQHTYKCVSEYSIICTKNKATKKQKW